MARRRKFSTFSLSFLDIMSCGFGAVVLVFLMIDHASNVHSETLNKARLAEVSLLEEQVLSGEKDLAEVRNTIDLVSQEIADADGLSRQILEKISETKREVAFARKQTQAQNAHVNQLKADIRSLEIRKQRLMLENEKKTGQNIRRITGDGDRQYLTGLRLGGRRNLILLDTSASMLDHTIVNIIRRRNMSDASKRSAQKWQRALSTVNWLTAQLPPGSQYQIYTFNTEVHAALPGTLGQWLPVSNVGQVEQALAATGRIIPQQGTSLENLFRTVKQLNPWPDNIILITDGLPTQGRTPVTSGTVSGRERQRFFVSAIKELPPNVPVNVILSPLEGDPIASSSFWKLAIATGGSYLSPSKDWP